MHIETIPSIHLALIANAAELNQKIIARFWSMYNHAETKRSHFFHGRFENLYIDREYIPEILPLITNIEQIAQHLLNRPNQLKCGYWFNLMRPGHQTSLHDHEEQDELLSAVYYLITPPNCGDLILGNPPLATRLAPNAGMAAFFPPNLMHAVETNASGEDRLSIAFNFGPNL